MFTGIITALGSVVTFRQNALEVRLPQQLSLAVGASLAVNGVCLTATRLNGQTMETDVSPETLRKTALGTLKPGDVVNLERPCRVGQTLDGHIVQGHVDTVGRVCDIEAEGNGYLFTFEVDADWHRYLVEKGSVAVDGISLTAFEVSKGRFKVAIVPHTYAHTNLQHKQAGDPVNVEFDVLGKYTEKLLSAQLRR